MTTRLRFLCGAPRVHRGAWGRGVLAAAFALAVLPAAARADDSHYQDFIVGGRAMALGGAYTSISDDPSGLWYNPAGIADVHESNYQVATSLYGFERGGYGEGALVLPVAGLENLNVEFTELIIVPASAGTVQTFGEPGWDGKPVNAYSVNVLVPSFRSFTVSNPFGDLGLVSDASILSEEAPQYIRRVSDRSLWSGIGYARRVTPWLSLGVSGFYVLRSATDVESITTRATVDETSVDAQVFRTAQNDISFINGSVVLGGGAKLKISESITAGLSFQTPSIPVHSESTLRFSTAESSPSCDGLGLTPQNLIRCQAEPLLAEPRSRFTSETIRGASETQWPATFRAGVSYVSKYRFTLSADATLHLPTSYELIKSDELTDEVRQRIPFNPQVQRNAVVNVNVGAEFLIVRQVSVAAGFFTDMSSAPSIPRAPQQDALPRVDIQGLTLTLGYFGEHSLSRIGVLYSFGEGHDVIPTSDVGRILETSQGFQRVDYFQSFFYIFLSSTFRY